MRTLVVSDSIHLCEKMCHEGHCGPCSLTSTVRCRCGSKTKVGGKTRRAQFDAFSVDRYIFLFFFSRRSHVRRSRQKVKSRNLRSPAVFFFFYSECLSLQES